MGLDQFADHDVMVAPLDDSGHLAFDRARRIAQDRRASRALAIGLAAELASNGVASLADSRESIALRPLGGKEAGYSRIKSGHDKEGKCEGES